MKKIAMAVLAAMILAAVCCSALAVTGDIVIKDAKAYSDAAMTNYVGTIPAGTCVIVRSYDKYADIYQNGKVLYVKESNLFHSDYTGAYRATLPEGSAVYQKPSTDASSTKVKSSGTVNVWKVKGDWALVRTTGVAGILAYVKVSSLTNIETIN